MIEQLNSLISPSYNESLTTIDPVLMRNKAATVEDLLLYGHTSLTGNEPNLVACWDFEQADGQMVHDIGANGNRSRLGKWAEFDAADPNRVDL